MGSERRLLELDSAAGSGAVHWLPADPEVREYFEKTVEYWDQIYTGSGFINWHLAHRRHLVIDAVRRLSNGRPLRVLDLGCGSGVLTRDLMRMGHSVVALDCSENMVRTLIHSVDGNLRPRLLGAEVGSAADVCLRTEAFDIVICVGVIQYQRHPELVFREMCRLLRPGGACIFTIPNQLTLHHVLDPWCSARYIYRLLVHQRRKGESLLRCFRSALDRAAYSDDIYERRYFKRDIPGLVNVPSLLVKETIGFGYGPVTVGNKAVFPVRFSIALSKALVKLSHLKPLSWLSTFANRWVIVLEKSS